VALVYGSGSVVTGSIGVLAVRPVVRRLFEKLGIGFEALLRGKYAALFATTQPLDEAQRRHMAAEIDHIYQVFLDRVTAGRKLDRAELDKIARGRVWTGAQAKERGLVDVLGGLHTAVGQIRERLGLDAEADVELVVYPPPKPLAQEIGEMLGGARAAAPLEVPLPRAVRQALGWLETLPVGAPALVPEVALEIR
jgi:protease-4